MKLIASKRTSAVASRANRIRFTAPTHSATSVGNAGEPTGAVLFSRVTPSLSFSKVTGLCQIGDVSESL